MSRARRLVVLSCLLGLVALQLGSAHAFADPKQPLPPNFPSQPTQTPNWPPPNWPPPHGTPSTPPPGSPPPGQPAGSPTPTQSSGGGSGGVAGAVASSSGVSGGAGRKTSGHAPAPHAAGTVTVAPQTSPPVHSAAPARHATKHPAPKPVLKPLAPVLPAPAAATDNRRSTFASRLLSPTGVDLSAKNLGEGGLIALLLFALLYLPVTIFNKATEKNDEAIERWLARPRAVLAALFGWIPLRDHPVVTLAVGVLASAFLFSFIEPGFPTEDGALQYGIGMVLGFALVSSVFFVTWRRVVHRLEPDSEGHWKIYPPFVFLAAFLVLMARLAHFLPGVVLGTVAEYQPGKKLTTRTAGIRVATTYGVLMVLGLAAWFAWIPVEHAARQEHASSLTLILDAALAITFVSALESVAFGLIPMRFLDGNDLYSWHKGLWAAMWGTAILWFSIVIVHPALSTYGHEVSGGRAVWFGLLFAALMLVAVTTWGYFRVREARAEKAARASAAAS